MVRRATAGDAATLGRLLHAFNAEYDEPGPPAELLTRRIALMLETGDSEAFLAGDGPDGFAIVRYRPSLYAEHEDCHLAELYVVGPLRGRGIGTAIMEAVLARARERGCGHVELNTSTDDHAARALYEKLGFTNAEGSPDGPSMLYYERDL